jgi:hypothetical protein
LSSIVCDDIFFYLIPPLVRVTCRKSGIPRGRNFAKADRINYTKLTDNHCSLASPTTGIATMVVLKYMLQTHEGEQKRGEKQIEENQFHYPKRHLQRQDRPILHHISPPNNALLLGHEIRKGTVLVVLHVSQFLPTTG